jgi:hypothetical protein
MSDSSYHTITVYTYYGEILTVQMTKHEAYLQFGDNLPEVIHELPPIDVLADENFADNISTVSYITNGAIFIPGSIFTYAEYLSRFDKIILSNSKFLNTIAKSAGSITLAAATTPISVLYVGADVRQPDRAHRRGKQLVALWRVMALSPSLERKRGGRRAPCKVADPEGGVYPHKKKRSSSRGGISQKQPSPRRPGGLIE